VDIGPSELEAPGCSEDLLVGNISTPFIIPPSFDYDISEGVRGTKRVPMLRVFRSFDGSEILIIAAASILVVSITFLF